MEDTELPEPQRFRIAIFGEGAVGKTAILHRFFTRSFLDKYKETVQDLHSKIYDVDGLRFQVEILDTAGNLSFPAMRRIEIGQAQAIILVYAVDNKESFQQVCTIFSQIKTTRQDYKTIPIVIAGNKCDLEEHELSVSLVETWISELSASGCQIRHLVTSAKSNENVEEIFKELVSLSGVMEKRKPELERMASADERPARRRFSFHKLNKPFLGRSKSVAQADAQRKTSTPVMSSVPPDSRRFTSSKSRKNSRNKMNRGEDEIEFCSVQ